MTIANYADLIAAVPGWLRRGDLASIVPDFVTFAEAQLNRDLRCQQMVTRTTITIDASVVAVPTDFLAPRSVRITSFNPSKTLQWVTTEQMDDLLDFTDANGDCPRHYTVEGSNFRFSPDPGVGPFTASLSYYAKLPPLVTNATNWLLSLSPDLYLYAALMNSAPYLRADDRLPMWSAAYQRLVDALNATSRGEGGRLQTIPSTLRSGGTP